MSDDKTGGPAFPFTPNQQMMMPDGTWDQNCDMGDSGMTLRDYFACAAMQGVLSNPDKDFYVEHGAEFAYTQADAMLAERSQP